MPKFGTKPVVIFERGDRVKYKQHGWEGTIIGKMFREIDVWRKRRTLS